MKFNYSMQRTTLNIEININGETDKPEVFKNLTFTELKVLFTLARDWTELYDYLCEMETNEGVTIE